MPSTRAAIAGESRARSDTPTRRTGRQFRRSTRSRLPCACRGTRGTRPRRTSPRCAVSPAAGRRGGRPPDLGRARRTRDPSHLADTARAPVRTRPSLTTDRSARALVAVCLRTTADAPIFGTSHSASTLPRRNPRCAIRLDGPSTEIRPARNVLVARKTWAVGLRHPQGVTKLGVLPVRSARRSSRTDGSPRPSWRQTARTARAPARSPRSARLGRPPRRCAVGRRRFEGSNRHRADLRVPAPSCVRPGRIGTADTARWRLRPRYRSRVLRTFARFEQLLLAADECEGGRERVEFLGDALGLWRGTPLEEFDGEWATIERARLERLRIEARLRRVDVQLGIGDDRVVLPELETLVGEHPLDEGIWSRLIVTLYRCGRQGDALRACRDVRQLLVEQLGVDPGPSPRPSSDGSSTTTTRCGGRSTTWHQRRYERRRRCRRAR